MTTIYAVGHSTRPLQEFEELLKAHEISRLVDIRTIPRSRYNPQFNRESLEKTLPKIGIRYCHMEALGGLRRTSKESINLGWRNASFRGFADYMLNREFASAVRKLMALAKKDRCAIMCAEGNPFRCHRSLVADALTVRGVEVLHISSRKSARKHMLTSFAKVDGTRITYPAA